MKPIILVATISVTIALIVFTIVTFRLQKTKTLTKGILLGYCLGIITDFIGLTSMYIAETRPMFTIHGILGYSAFLLMVTGVIRAARIYRKGITILPEDMRLYFKYTYGLWATAYFSGMLMSSLW